MASFIVADLIDTLVGVVQISDFGEVFGCEGFDGLLVEGIDRPLGAEKVLEEEIVLGGGTGAGRRDHPGPLGGKGGSATLIIDKER